VLIDQLKVTVMQYEQKLKNIEDDKEALKAANTALDALKTEYRVLKDDYDDVEATIEQLSSDAADEIQHREKKIRTLSMLVDEKEADCIRMQAEIYDLKKETAKLQKQIKDTEDAATANAWFSK
jgi:chromosome segregation ATPase